ncbi:MAG: dienelactone hydrolase family protein [Dongiaceae bacterium]
MLALIIAAGLAIIAAPARADPGLTGGWPEPGTISQVTQEAVTFPSSSPFLLTDAGSRGAEPTTAYGTLFLPAGRQEPRSLPAVVMLHGSGGVLAARELTYGKQLAAMGVVALAVDAFSARRDRGTRFTERLLNITETMLVADGYAGLAYLAARPEVDPDRVALVGFSYGAMATMYALNAQVAERLARDGHRFAGHAAFYGPCIARFADRRTTGAPLLLLYGDADEIIDRGRCDEAAADFRAGGSEVETVVYPGAVHQWDGSSGRRLIGRNLAGCDFVVRADGTVQDRNSGFVMTGSLMRKLLLSLCVEDRPYPLGRDDAVRRQSNNDLGRFLTRVFRLPAG